MKNRYTTFLFCVLPSAALLACGADAQQSPADVGTATGGTPAFGTGGTAVVVGAGGALTGAGGAVAPGAGGATPLGAGGSTIPSAGGANPLGAGGSAVGAGGAVQAAGGATGAGGAAQVGGTEYTFTTAHFSVPPGGEVYKCQDFTNPFGKDIGIVQNVVDLTPGSHHMFAFVLPNSQMTLKGSLSDCPGGGVEFHDYLTTSATPVATTNYPPNTGRIFSAGNGIRLMVHLINADTAPKDAFVVYKLTYVDPAGLANKVASIFLNQVALAVPAGMSTQTKTYSLTQTINLLGDASHMHKHGIRFVASASSGQMLYDGTEWAEPAPKSFSPALSLASGTKITWACTYNNDSGQTLTFGESAAANEMCIFVGEFYNSTGTQISYQAAF